MIKEGETREGPHNEDKPFGFFCLIFVFTILHKSKLGKEAHEGGIAVKKFMPFAFGLFRSAAILAVRKTLEMRLRSWVMSVRG